VAHPGLAREHVEGGVEEEHPAEGEAGGQVPALEGVLDALLIRVAEDVEVEVGRPETP
jgi:hypothetical protein